MRIAVLLTCLLLTACAGGKLPGEQPAPSGSGFTPSVTAAPTGQTAASLDPPAGSEQERAQQARAECWMKVEHQKQLRGIDHRLAYVEKCVAEQVRQAP
jgi:hypothetical protein